jgi:hypothetical protein
LIDTEINAVRDQRIGRYQCFRSIQYSEKKTFNILVNSEVTFMFYRGETLLHLFSLQTDLAILHHIDFIEVQFLYNIDRENL